MDQLGRWSRFCSSVFRATPAEWRGKARLARCVLGRQLRDEDVLLHTRWGALAVPSTRDPMGFNLLINGTYEPDSLRLLEESLYPGARFVDVGATIGLMTVVAARRVGAAGRVLALEASARMHRYLQENVRRNQLSDIVTVKHCAVQDVEGGSRAFYDAPLDNFGMGALVPQFSQTPTLVPTRTLDAVLSEWDPSPIDVLKVDVEGFEASVFQGACRALTAERAPLILFEFTDWADTRAGFAAGFAQEFLLRLGYRLALLPDWLRAKTYLEGPLISGDEIMLVAVPPHRQGERPCRCFLGPCASS
jgi:FkbM family methyltransferase